MALGGVVSLFHFHLMYLAFTTKSFLVIYPFRDVRGAGVGALRPAQPRIVKRTKQPILSRGSDRRCTCS